MGWFSEEHGRILTRFAFFVVLPPFMFLAITSSSVANSVDLSFLIQYELSTVLVFLIAIFIARRFFFLKHADPAMFGLNSSYPNYGYIGVPLCLLAFGAEAAMPMGLILVADTIVLLTLAALVSAQSSSTSFKTSLKQMGYSMIRNPLLLAVIISFSALALNIKLPQSPTLLLEMLAGAAAPTALFALGITLVGQPISSVRNELGSLVILKLIIHPLLTATIFLCWPFLGFERASLTWIKVAILFSCLPVAANVYALSQFYLSYSGRTATAIMSTTALASFTVPLTLYFLESLV